MLGWITGVRGHILRLVSAVYRQMGGRLAEVEKVRGGFRLRPQAQTAGTQTALGRSESLFLGSSKDGGVSHQEPAAGREAGTDVFDV